MPLPDALAADGALPDGTLEFRYEIGEPLTRPHFPTVGATVTVDGSASSSSVASTISDWAWDFGDGNTGSGSSTTHSYSSAGTYTIKLTITDSRGVKQSSTQTVTVS